MKTRRGFVSNSSSTSFVCIVCNGKFNQAYGGEGTEECPFEEEEKDDSPDGIDICKKCNEIRTICRVCGIEIATKDAIGIPEYNPYSKQRVTWEILNKVHAIHLQYPYLWTLMENTKPYYICPKCWPTSYFGIEWFKKFKDPSYEITEMDREISKKLPKIG